MSNDIHPSTFISAPTFIVHRPLRSPDQSYEALEVGHQSAFPNEPLGLDKIQAFGTSYLFFALRVTVILSSPSGSFGNADWWSTSKASYDQSRLRKNTNRTQVGAEMNLVCFEYLLTWEVFCLFILQPFQNVVTP